MIEKWLPLALFITIIAIVVYIAPISMSGATKTLRDNGEFTRTTIYDNDTLVYKYWSSLTKRELKALYALSRHYVIITKEHKNDTLK